MLLQDAVKNRVEMATRTTDMTYDPVVSRGTIDMVWEVCRQSPGCLLVPGQDLPMIAENGKVRPLGHHSARISALLGETHKDVVHFELGTSRSP